MIIDHLERTNRVVDCWPQWEQDANPFGRLLPPHQKESIDELIEARDKLHNKSEEWSKTPEGNAYTKRQKFRHFVLYEMRKLGKTPEQLAVEINLPIRHLYHILRGEVGWTEEIWSKIMDKLGHGDFMPFPNVPRTIKPPDRHPPAISSGPSRNLLAGSPITANFKSETVRPDYTDAVGDLSLIA